MPNLVPARLYALPKSTFIGGEREIKCELHIHSPTVPNEAFRVISNQKSKVRKRLLKANRA